HGTVTLTPSGVNLTLPKPNSIASPKADKAKLQQPPSTSAASFALEFEFLHANANARLQGNNQLPANANYFLGSAPSAWRTAVPLFIQVKLKQLYPGIDLIYYGNERQLEYDFVVAPGANPENISFCVSGAERL